MHAPLTTLIDRMDSLAATKANVIRWSCPVPAFGDLANSRVATVGLNPSNREFVDLDGKELQGPLRRFHTLNSLGLRSWSDVDARHLHLILESCRSYFVGNPYDAWFKRLDLIISAVNASYYDPARPACHLDLIPYATHRKWTELTAYERATLLSVAADTLALLLRDSPVELLILNGASVVTQFQAIAAGTLDRREMPAWSLPRVSGARVKGVAYSGVVDTLSGIPLGHSIRVVGFNHNLQGTYGVTSAVMEAIRRWIAQITSEALL